MTQGNEAIQPKRDGSEIIARLPKDGLRSLFHLMVGRPDSTQRAFDRPILISPESVVDLNDRITDKLRNHSVEGMVVTVDVSSNHNRIIQFGSWAEFLTHKWNTADETRELVAKWDFVLMVPGYDFPQRHSVTVTITGELKAVHILREVFSEERDPGDKFELKYSPVVCKVDFINHILSKELLNVVDEWDRALPQPQTENTFLDRLKLKTPLVKALVRYSPPVLFLITSFFALDFIASQQAPNSTISVGFLTTLMYWLLGVFSSLYLAIVFSNWLATRAEFAIENYGKFFVFAMTNGDKNKQTKWHQRNSSYVKQFFLSTGTSLTLDVIAGFIVYWLTR